MPIWTSNHPTVATSVVRGASGSIGCCRRPLRAPAPTCAVDYRVREDPDQRFTADLRVTNTIDQPQRHWTLTFTFPGDQTITQSGSGVWEQRGREVVIRPPAGEDLAPEASASIRLTGRHQGDNRLPVTFHLNGSTCEVQLTAVPASANIPDREPEPVVDRPGGKERGGKSGPDRSGGKGPKKDDDDGDDDD